MKKFFYIMGIGWTIALACFGVAYITSPDYRKATSEYFSKCV